MRSTKRTYQPAFLTVLFTSQMVRNHGTAKHYIPARMLRLSSFPLACIWFSPLELAAMKAVIRTACG